MTTSTEITILISSIIGIIVLNILMLYPSNEEIIFDSNFTVINVIPIIEQTIDKEFEIENELKREINNLKYEIEYLEEEIEDLEDDMIDPETADKLGTITGNEIRNILMYYNISTIYISDVNYSLTSVKEAKRFNKETKVHKNWAIKEKFDCDEYAASLYGYWNHDNRQFAFGLAWSRTHAFNIMIDDDRQLWIIEPQWNRFIKIEDVEDEKYEISRFVIV